MARPTPTSQVLVDTALELDEKKALLFTVCQELLPGWDKVALADVDVTPVSGGISNMTLKFAPKDAAVGAVAVKVFGDKTEVLIDRDRERQCLLSLNAAGFGAEVLGFFSNGRIERFLNAKTLQPTDLPDPAYLPRIAARLRSLHAARIAGWPFADALFPTIDSWFTIASALAFPDPAKQATYETLDFAWMRSEIGRLRRLSAAAGSPLVFAHCDLLSGNILEILGAAGATGPAAPPTGPAGPPQGAAAAGPVGGTDAGAAGGAQADGRGATPRRLQFIDFEYSAYCPRGFDFGNHFNEYAGFDCDYSLYPSAAQQKDFFRAYLGGQAAGEAVLDTMVAEANLFSLVSHVYWGVWALVQARYSAIDFDFVGYSIMRWDQYRKTKDEFIQQAEAVFAVAAA